MFRFAQHESVVNGIGGIDALLPPACSQSPRWRQSRPQLLCGDDSPSQIAAATNSFGSGSHPDNRPEYFPPPAFSSVAGDRRLRTDGLHHGCAEAIAKQASPWVVAMATRAPVDKSP